MIAEVRADPGHPWRGRSLLKGEILAHLSEGNPQFAFPLWRELLDDPELSRKERGNYAATFAWSLLGHYPDEMVPAEVRNLTMLAWSLVPDHPLSLALRGVLAATDERAVEALQFCDRANHAYEVVPKLQASFACIRSVAHAQHGDWDLSMAWRDRAISFWSECDLLPWRDDQARALVHGPTASDGVGR